jgi:hypothetical protein
MWVNLIIGLVLSLVGLLLRPKPEPPKPNTIGDFNIPITKEGSEIPIVYGTVWITSPQIVWYGDFRTEPVKTRTPKK